jgi:dihydroorotate dehydrogenase (NAD+) catalytic subunit
MNKLETKLGNLNLKTPLLTAAGCSGHRDELSKLEGFDFSKLGAFVTKGVTLDAQKGNLSHRIAEVPGGILNSIGLQNKGLEYFMEKELPLLVKYNIPIIVNLAANSIVVFETLFEKIKKYSGYNIIEGIEINVSCPNVNSNGAIIGQEAMDVELIVREARNYCRDKYIITKLSPNVANIVEIAEAAIEGGTDSLSMINTVRGCAVDIESKGFVLGRKFGGLSGPCLKSIGLLAVHECRTKIDECKSGEVPIIGVGGIMNYRDVLEYIMVGASAVQIGTGFLINSNIFNKITLDLENYLKEEDKNIKDLIGIVE